MSDWCSDAPIEIIIGSIFLYKLLGVSCFIGLAVTCLFLPLNHFAGKVVVRAQDNLMSARDERVALMNEVHFTDRADEVVMLISAVDPGSDSDAQGLSNDIRVVSPSCILIVTNVRSSWLGSAASRRRSLRSAKRSSAGNVSTIPLRHCGTPSGTFFSFSKMLSV